MTLFLDFDGVLHPDPCSEEAKFCRLNLVQGVLREFPQVDIVLSTTWRLRDPLDTSGTHLKHYFSGDIAGRIVGVTQNHKDLDRSQAPDGHPLQTNIYWVEGATGLEASEVGQLRDFLENPRQQIFKDSGLSL